MENVTLRSQSATAQHRIGLFTVVRVLESSLCEGGGGEGEHVTRSGCFQTHCFCIYSFVIENGGVVRIGMYSGLHAGNVIVYT